MIVEPVLSEEWPRSFECAVTQRAAGGAAAVVRGVVAQYAVRDECGAWFAEDATAALSSSVRESKPCKCCTAG